MLRYGWANPRQITSPHIRSITRVVLPVSDRRKNHSYRNTGRLCKSQTQSRVNRSLVIFFFCYRCTRVQFSLRSVRDVLNVIGSLAYVISVIFRDCRPPEDPGRHHGGGGIVDGREGCVCVCEG